MHLAWGAGFLTSPRRLVPRGRVTGRDDAGLAAAGRRTGEARRRLAGAGRRLAGAGRRSAGAGARSAGDGRRLGRSWLDGIWGRGGRRSGRLAGLPDVTGRAEAQPEGWVQAGRPEAGAMQDTVRA
jgi:hypothetical protein